MILIGQFDSSFTRRVGIALRLYDMPFEHRPWSVFGDADRLMELNPLGRVPVLVLDDGTALIDSHMILDHLDGCVPPDRRIFPVADPARHQALRIAALATGLGDRVVSLFYERRLHDLVSPALSQRLSRQIAATLRVLEQERLAAPRDWWHGDTPGHADIAVACVLRHLRDALPDTFDPVAYPTLSAHCARAEALPVFAEISQPFVAPA